jgi:hypothetical protein
MLGRLFLAGIGQSWLRGSCLLSESPLRGSALHDQFDVTLEDSDLLGEVELTTNLIIAASESDEPLTLDEIDRILGIVPSPRTDS